MSDPDIAAGTVSWGADGGEWALLVHGGAGDSSEDLAERRLEGCRAAAAEGARVLLAGGCALDAVERAVAVLEDDPTFNAGTGACLNADGLIELDAGLMEGAGLRAGAICAMQPFRHPIAIARAVLEAGRHVLYAAGGAARFAVEHGFVPATSEQMTTEAARARWAAARERASAAGGTAGGTVGAVARDMTGVVAAATSTGGLAGKRPGRVGDSPLIGAGMYADNDGGACSATGGGEAIMRVCLAKATTDAMRAGIHPREAARSSIRAMSTRVGGFGGVILVDRAGRLGVAHNTPAMSWAAAGELLP